MFARRFRAQILLLAFNYGVFSVTNCAASWSNSSCKPGNVRFGFATLYTVLNPLGLRTSENLVKVLDPCPRKMYVYANSGLYRLPWGTPWNSSLRIPSLDSL